MNGGSVRGRVCRVCPACRASRARWGGHRAVRGAGIAYEQHRRSTGRARHGVPRPRGGVAERAPQVCRRRRAGRVRLCHEPVPPQAPWTRRPAGSSLARPPRGTAPGRHGPHTGRPEHAAPSGSGRPRPRGWWAPSRGRRRVGAAARGPAAPHVRAAARVGLALPLYGRALAVLLAVTATCSTPAPLRPFRRRLPAARRGPARTARPGRGVRRRPARTPRRGPLPARRAGGLVQAPSAATADVPRATALVRRPLKPRWPRRPLVLGPLRSAPRRGAGHVPGSGLGALRTAA